MKSAISLALLLAVPAAAQQVAPTAATDATPYRRAVAAGYKALTLCNSVFAAGRPVEAIEAQELRGIYPEYQSLVTTLPATVDRRTATVSVAFDTALPPRAAGWDARDGCTLAPVGGRPATSRATGRAPLPADPRPWPMGDAGIAPRPAPVLAAAISRAFDGSFGEGATTTGVVVLRDGAVVAERYADGWGPLVPNRTWSVAKSIAGTLAGLARLAPQDPAAIPEWADPADPRHALTVDQLLRMASGLHSDTAGNRTDAIYFGGTAVTEQATGWPLAAAPGTRFRYANNDILLAVRAMRTRLGDARYVGFPTTALFAPIGMRHTQAGRDWRGNYILSSQVWSTARDLARLGQFWLQDGVWQGRRLLPDGWMRYMTTPSGPQPATGPGYGATLWLFGPAQALPAGSYAAQGNRGQYVMVIPSERLVIVRRGEDAGAARFDIARFSADIVAAR